MISRLASLPPRSRLRMAASAFAMFAALPLPTTAEEATAPPADAVAQPPAPSNPLASIAAQHPQVRSLAVARANCVVFEYYRENTSAQTQSAVNSVTKSALSILVGIAIDEGYLRLDQKLSEVFPEEFDEAVDPLVRDITVRDLLTKTEGFAEIGPGDFKITPAVPGKSQGWRWMINRRIGYPRGTHFRYDGIGSDLLAVVLSKAIRQDARDYARQKLLGPLQIVNYTWYADSEGHLRGEYGLYLTARDMAKIGRLFLQRGRWGDKQILSEAYVQDATTRQSDGGPPVNAAYGYQWWASQTNPGAYFASGYGGQLIFVAPHRDLVVTVSANASPWGDRKYFSEVVLPAAAELARSAPCLDQNSRLP